MRGLYPIAAVVALFLLVESGADREVRAQAQNTQTAPQEQTARAATPSAPSPDIATNIPIEKFAGGWDYNPVESINAATGRPEQGGRSATARAGARGGAVARGGGSGGGTGGAAPRAGNAGGSTPAAGGAGGYGGYGGGFYGGDFGPTPDMIAQSRALSRDLLEVPEALTIKVSSDTVVITDDLKRERTYFTDGRKQKYQIGAASFEARTYWDGSHLRKEIEGAYGFRMTETYFLSADGSRMFVVVRVGQQKKDAPLVGFDRVYDRIEGGGTPKRGA